MIKNTKSQISAVLAVGVVLGYLAASGRLNPFGRADADQPSASTSAWTRLPAQEVLPFPPTPSASIAGRTMQDSVYKQRVEPRRLPKDAPNILIVLIDDVGPAQASTFGGMINTPTMDRIAKGGIAYNRFHTTAMCSPTRSAPVCARNHHRVGNGQMAELANDWE